MASVRLTGPIKEPRSAGSFGTTETREMTADFSVTDADTLNKAFIASDARKVLTAVSDAESVDGPQRKMSISARDAVVAEADGQDDQYMLVDGRADFSDSPWSIAISGLGVRRLYDHACAISSDTADYTNYLWSPFTVLARWAKSGRYTRRNDSPASMMEFIAKAAIADEDGFEVLAQPVEWDRLQDGYDEFHRRV